MSRMIHRARATPRRRNAARSDAATTPIGGRVRAGWWSVARTALLAVALPACAATGATAARPATPAVGTPAPLVIGETVTLASTALGEVRRINVYVPPAYGEADTARRPVLYMPDGGLAEDFLHVAGLVQISVLNGTMRPVILVGIENTERRRDLTGPTTSARDSAIAPRVGGSAAFRTFLRTELMPWVEGRYRTTSERAIVGESLAGLFVVETLLLEPDLFDTYMAFDPSLWWNDQQLIELAASRVRFQPGTTRRLFLANSSEPELAAVTERLADALVAASPPGLVLRHVRMPDETHGTIYHPAALRAFRTMLGPTAPTGLR
jgi:predicted alpha/beta superfamily hydrolase